MFRKLINKFSKEYIGVYKDDLVKTCTFCGNNSVDNPESYTTFTSEKTTFCICNKCFKLALGNSLKPITNNK